MSKSAIVLLANGFEEIEATCPIDLLRRAKTEVSVASCEDKLLVTGRSSIKLEADCLFDGEIGKDHDMLVLPGGPAVFELRKNPRVLSFIRDFDDAGKPIGAICAAPLLLLTNGVEWSRIDPSTADCPRTIPFDFPPILQQRSYPDEPHFLFPLRRVADKFHAPGTAQRHAFHATGGDTGQDG